MQRLKAAIPAWPLFDPSEQPGIPSAVTDAQTTLIHFTIFCQTPATHDRKSHRSHHQKAASTDNTENVPRPHCAPAASTAARRQDMDLLWIQLSKGDKWTPAQVIAPSSTPRSYEVQTDDRRTYCRNRLFMKPWTSPPVTPPSPTPEPTPQKAPTPPPPGAYLTRSGRAVKTRRKMDL